MIWSLLWSQRQNALHIEPMETTLSNNRSSYRDDAPGDYRILFLGTRTEVELAAENMRRTLAEREAVKRAIDRVCTIPSAVERINRD